MKVPRPLLLAILDGWGVNKSKQGNAIAAARTPVMDALLDEYPSTTLVASGEAVGLPPGQMGNSEVGHLNIGAGRLVLQDFQRINYSIRDGGFFRNEVLLGAIRQAVSTDGKLHLMGLLSDGGVHSHIEHLFALLEMSKSEQVNDVCVHAFLDGRDVPPRSALTYVRMLEDFCRDIGIGSIRTIMGRYYAMDRDNRWDRTRLAYDAVARSESPRVGSAEEAIRASYDDGVDDEFLVPRVVGESAPMDDDDAVIFFNFRPDRPRQLTRPLIEKDFKEFDRGPAPPFPYLVTMTEYEDQFDVTFAFAPEEVEEVLADVLAEHGKTQLHIAETEKYAHVTYFFNGGVEEPKKGEDRVLIPSPKVATYNLKPEMSAYEVVQETVRRIESERYDFIVLNFANGDMVGHTGIMEAAVKAVEATDKSLGIVLDELSDSGGGAFVTGDHGNAETMLDDGSACTAHSCSSVPFINATKDKRPLRAGGTLGDIAPTILEVLQLPKPEEMTGTSLFLRLK
ncbi:MAG: 2,3-bisphosphoglycerate-independent phosphoglycerate mutase [Actinobacteria bacterium]|nr:2,3-bisphosphoglycerate-independent phosphoglycerate mutase [Actinomycetota bacterium]